MAEREFIQIGEMLTGEDIFNWIVCIMMMMGFTFIPARVGRQVVNVPSFMVRVDSQKHIDFSLTSPFGGGRPGRVKRKNQKAAAKKASGGDGDEDDEEWTFSTIRKLKHHVPWNVVFVLNRNSLNFVLTNGSVCFACVSLMDCFLFYFFGWDCMKMDLYNFISSTFHHLVLSYRLCYLSIWLCDKCHVHFH